MRIDCPSCAAAYEVPDSLLAAGRTVRCARCGKDWVPVAEKPVEPEPARPEHTPPPRDPVPAGQSAMDRLAAQPAEPPSTLKLRIAWAASLIVLLLLAGAAYGWRTQIMQAWPPSARAYAILGLRPATPAAR